MIEIKDGLFGRDINLKSSVYIKVFGEVPRNEGYECKNKHCTKKYYALSEIEKENLKECLLCGRQLEKVYDEEILQIEWEKRSEKKGYIEKLAWKNQELIWFILWWEANLSSLNQEKFELNKNAFNITEKKIFELYPNFLHNDFFYFSEIWLEAQYRGTSEHVASALYNAMEVQVELNGKEFVIVRTTKKSDLPFKWFQKLGYKVVYMYNDENDRVIMIKNLSNK